MGGIADTSSNTPRRGTEELRDAVGLVIGPTGGKCGGCATVDFGEPLRTEAWERDFPCSLVIESLAASAESAVKTNGDDRIQILGSVRGTQRCSPTSTKGGKRVREKGKRENDLFK